MAYERITINPNRVELAGSRDGRGMEPLDDAFDNDQAFEIEP
jgi:hypothetical protein